MKLSSQRDVYIYALWRLAGVAILNAFYSKKQLFLGGDQTVVVLQGTAETRAFFPESVSIQGFVQPKEKINYFQNLCENLSLIRNLRILFFLGKWHILKWAAKLYLSKSEWVTALKMFKKCENVEAIQLMNHAKAFDGSQLLTAISFEEKEKKRCCQDSYTWITVVFV